MIMTTDDTQLRFESVLGNELRKELAGLYLHLQQVEFREGVSMGATVAASISSMVDTGAHAAAESRTFHASRGRDARLGGARLRVGSFPRTDGRHLPAARMFRAALTSRS